MKNHVAKYREVHQIDRLIDYIIDSDWYWIGLYCMLLDWIGFHWIVSNWTELNSMIDCSFIHQLPIPPQASKITPFRWHNLLFPLTTWHDEWDDPKPVLSKNPWKLLLSKPSPHKEDVSHQEIWNLSCELYPSQSSPYCFSDTCGHLKFAGNAGKLMRFDFFKLDLHDSKPHA